MQIVSVALGYRSVPLKNSYNEDLELASLLVHINVVRGRVSPTGQIVGGCGDHNVPRGDRLTVAAILEALACL